MDWSPAGGEGLHSGSLRFGRQAGSSGFEVRIGPLLHLERTRESIPSQVPDDDLLNVRRCAMGAPTVPL